MFETARFPMSGNLSQPLYPGVLIRWIGFETARIVCNLLLKCAIQAAPDASRFGLSVMASHAGGLSFRTRSFHGPAAGQAATKARASASAFQRGRRKARS